MYAGLPAYDDDDHHHHLGRHHSHEAGRYLYDAPPLPREDQRPNHDSDPDIDEQDLAEYAEAARREEDMAGNASRRGTGTSLSVGSVYRHSLPPPRPSVSSSSYRHVYQRAGEDQYESQHGYRDPYVHHYDVQPHSYPDPLLFSSPAPLPGPSSPPSVSVSSARTRSSYPYGHFLQPHFAADGLTGEESPEMFKPDAPHHLRTDTGAGGAGEFGAIGRHSVLKNDDIEDLPHFPRWSRAWYGGHLSTNGHAYTAYTPPSAVGGGSSDPYGGWETAESGGAYSHPSLLAPSFRPHGGSARQQHQQLAEYVKEERIRMLEKEFGTKVKRKGEEAAEEDEDEEKEELLPGTVDNRGRLVTVGKKKRAAARWAQGVLGLSAVGAGVGGVLLLKPNPAPPPKGTLPSYVLYVVSLLSFLLTFYLYVISPTCCAGPRRRGGGGQGWAGADGLGGLVIPVISAGGPAGGGGCCGGRKKTPMTTARASVGGLGGGRRGAQPVSVNLIVDPSLLGAASSGGLIDKKTTKKKKGRRQGGVVADDGDSEPDASSSSPFSSDDDDDHLPGRARRGRKRGKGRRPAAGALGVVGQMRMKARWAEARTSLKVRLAWDVVQAVVWIFVSVLVIGVGKKCPPGTAGGWCDAYNGATACGALLIVAFGASIFFDATDLRMTRRPPKAVL